MRHFGKNVLALIGCLAFCLQCGLAIPPEMGEEVEGGDEAEEEGGTEAPSDMRAITGSLANGTTAALTKNTGKSGEHGCQADEVLAMDSEGRTSSGAFHEDCSFSLTVKTGAFYIITFLNGGEFVATITFNRIASSFLPVMANPLPLDLGKISRVGSQALCDDEEGVLCPIDSDGDGIGLCDDADEQPPTTTDEANHADDADEAENGDGAENPSCDDDHKVSVCHRPPGNPEKARTICVDLHSVTYAAHLKHGDTIGACYAENDEAEDENDSEDDADESEEVEEQEEDLEEEDDEEVEEDSCREPVRAKFDFTRLANWNGGDLEPLVFVGMEEHPYESGEWIELTDESGRPLIDQDVVMDVPGIALRRGDGWVQFFLWGFHDPCRGKEALTGEMVFDGATVIKMKNNPAGPFESQGDGIGIFGRAGQDEYYAHGEDGVMVISTVTVHYDSFTVTYRPESSHSACSCCCRP